MSRRSELADAAITTLAREGSRGLTHRAVDRAAGVAEGSTSYYFRTRQELLEATVRRLAELDMAEAPDLPHSGLNDFADAAAEVVRRLLTSGRERQLARYELALEATRRPELRAVLAESGAAFREGVAGIFAALGAPQPRERAYDFVAFVDGLVFDQLAGAGSRDLSPEEVRDSTLRLVSAAAGEPRSSRRGRRYRPSRVTGTAGDRD